MGDYMNIQMSIAPIRHHQIVKVINNKQMDASVRKEVSGSSCRGYRLLSVSLSLNKLLKKLV